MVGYVKIVGKKVYSEVHVPWFKSTYTQFLQLICAACGNNALARQYSVTDKSKYKDIAE